MNLSPLELAAVACGFANMLLLIRRSRWNFLFGIVMVSLYGLLFWQSKLYATAALQILFLGLNIYGWWAWSQASRTETQTPVRRMAPKQIALAVLAAVALWGIAWLLVSRTSDAASPGLDSLNLALSLTAQMLLAWRFTENWLFWIAVNLVSIALFASQALWPTTLLYGVFLGLAIQGWRSWRASNHPQ
jgi:nicotinamide mononucleotide transporter